MNLRLQAGKTIYSVAEAARALDVTVGQFRSLLLRLLLESKALEAVQLMRFRPSDLQILRLFANQAPAVPVRR